LQENFFKKSPYWSHETLIVGSRSSLSFVVLLLASGGRSNTTPLLVPSRTGLELGAVDLI
jgi:hypothetical protein